MKIKWDFVTNSSSTSFILITEKEFCKEDFFSCLGANEDSEFSFIFNQLFQSVKEEMVPYREYFKQMLNGNETIEEYIENRFSKELLSKIFDSEKKGKNIYTGQLKSDNETYESFFCQEPFICENNEIYFNGVECGW